MRETYETIEKSIECLKRSKVEGFENLRLIKIKRQARNLKKVLTERFKVEFCQKQVGVFKCPDKRCECCASLLLGNSYTFKSVDKTFNLKAPFACDTSNLLYVAIYSTCCEEYTGETGIGKTILRDRVRVYRQHIRQREYQKLKIAENLRTCCKGSFKMFPLLQMRCSKIDLRRSYRRIFMKK